MNNLGLPGNAAPTNALPPNAFGLNAPPTNAGLNSLTPSPNATPSTPNQKPKYGKKTHMGTPKRTGKKTHMGTPKRTGKKTHMGTPKPKKATGKVCSCAPGSRGAVPKANVIEQAEKAAEQAAEQAAEETTKEILTNVLEEMPMFGGSRKTRKSGVLSKSALKALIPSIKKKATRRAKAISKKIVKKYFK